MDIYNYLKKDHRKVSSLMEEVLNAENTSKREELFEEIKKELTLHAKTEEATFYAALEDKKKTHDDIEHAEDEHHEIEQYLKQLSEVSAGTEEWMKLFKEFQKVVEHHVKEEENEIFPKAQKILDDKDADKLADKMDVLKDNLKNNNAA